MSDDQPMMTLREQAIGLHEAYTSFLEAGFTPRQALYLTACMLRAPETPNDDENGGKS
ncbi:hypothetical protein [Nocardiopsis sp. NPDC057823]|uniref:hypothetical protein n=1 Tax=Nocardiopsis sp. NPDC057823 TaxID=3346256 RepID=UPI00366B3686